MIKTVLHLFALLVICINLPQCVSIKPYLVRRVTVDDYLNTCLDGGYHKSKPGPEASLFKQCAPWKERSCCTNETTVKMHNDSQPWLNFNWNHCGPLPPKCQKQFMQDLCFYECSPNVGLWLKPVHMKIRKEKFYNVPLCQSDCDNWWADCMNASTCLDNWGKGFNWTSGTNTCPSGSVCRPFSVVFGNAKKFCERIWNYSFKILPDTEPCMTLWFNSSHNPNDAVARKMAEFIVSKSTINTVPAIMVVFLALIAPLL